jgi:hypothetical protein
MSFYWCVSAVYLRNSDRLLLGQHLKKDEISESGLFFGQFSMYSIPENSIERSECGSVVTYHHHAAGS